MPDVKLILLKEILAQKDVLFTRQKGAVAVKRRDGWERISELAHRHRFTKTLRPGTEFKNNKYRVWEDVFMVRLVHVDLLVYLISCLFLSHLFQKKVRKERRNRETKYEGNLRPAPVVFDAYDEVFFEIRGVDRASLILPKFVQNVCAPEVSDKMSEKCVDSNDCSRLDVECAILRRELLRKDCVLRDIDIEYRRRELVFLNLRIARFERDDDLLIVGPIIEET